MAWGQRPWWSPLGPFALGRGVCSLSSCGICGNVEARLASAHCVSSGSARLSPSEIQTGRREKTFPLQELTKPSAEGLRLTWADTFDTFGDTVGICFHSTLNFIKIQIMKSDEVELRKQIPCEFYFGRNLVFNSENSQSKMLCFIPLENFPKYILKCTHIVILYTCVISTLPICKVTWLSKILSI